MGVHRATQTFDPAKGAFSTFAVHWIRQAIGRHIENAGSTIRVPVHVHQKRRAAGVRATPVVRSLDAKLPTRHDGGPVTLADLLVDENTPSPDATLDAHEARVELARILTAARLNPQERIVVGLRSEGLTLEQIGERMDRTRERVRQVEVNAMRKMRKAARVSPSVTGGLGGLAADGSPRCGVAL